MWIEVLIALAGLVLLVAGADVMIRGAVDLALRARISPLVVGLTVVSLGTSAPELLVSLFAAFKGSTDITIGNVVGSNISNITLVLGLCTVVLPIEVDRDARRIHWPVLMAVTILLVVLMLDDVFQRWEGIMFTAMLVGYVTALVWSSRRSQRLAGTAPPVPQRAAWLSVAMLLGGVAALSYGADLFVEGAVAIARTMGVSEQLIGVTIVALGTSMPELVTSLLAAFRGQADISLGNLVGSNIFNALGILGITAIVKPIPVSLQAFSLDMGFMLGTTLLLLPLMWAGYRFGRPKGAILLLAYLVYVVLVLQRG